MVFLTLTILEDSYTTRERLLFTGNKKNTLICLSPKTAGTYLVKVLFNLLLSHLLEKFKLECEQDSAFCD